MMRGLQLAMGLGSGRSVTELLATRETNPVFEARWIAAIEACRGRPNDKFADVLKPEGDIIKRIATNSRPRKR